MATNMAALFIHTIGCLTIGYCIGMALVELMTWHPAIIPLNLQAPVRASDDEETDMRFLDAA